MCRCVSVCVSVFGWMYADMACLNVCIHIYTRACTLPCNYFSVSCNLPAPKEDRLVEQMCRKHGHFHNYLEKRHSLQKSNYPSNECTRKATKTNTTSCRERLYVTPGKQQNVPLQYKTFTSIHLHATSFFIVII